MGQTYLFAPTNILDLCGVTVQSFCLIAIAKIHFVNGEGRAPSPVGVDLCVYPVQRDHHPPEFESSAAPPVKWGLASSDISS
jgi:hypothetical protein